MTIQSITLDKMDVRFKMASMALLSIAVLKADTAGLTLLSLMCLGLGLFVRCRIKVFIRHLRYLGFLLMVIFMARALNFSFFPGDADSWMTFDSQGALDGLRICWRLILLSFLGVLWITTTRPSGIRTAVEWFCRPFPALPGKQAATMMSLMVRFLPVIVEKAGETSAAQQCRCIQNRKNPVYRTVKFSMPLLCRTLETADRLADAMEARCYTPESSRPLGLTTCRADWFVLVGTAGVCALMII